MLDWIFEGIVTWVSSIASELMDAVSRVFLDALGTDMDAMEGYFPFRHQGLRGDAVHGLGSPVPHHRVASCSGCSAAPSPRRRTPGSSCCAAPCSPCWWEPPGPSSPLCIGHRPGALHRSHGGVHGGGGLHLCAGIEEALKNGLTTIVSTVTVVGPILILILLIALGWNYFKLLLECVERYIVVGVLCYTSPLAFAMGGSKATNQVFKSWCRMVGSQLLLLVLNVWFLRAFDSSVGQFIGNGGALASGGGSVFLWLFCALAFLKTAQKFDSYLAAMGLNVAQTGSSMAMEMVMAARVLSGLGGGAKSAGSVFRSGGSAASSAATGAGAAASSFSAGICQQVQRQLLRPGRGGGGRFPDGLGRQRGLCGPGIWGHRRPKRGGAHRGVHLLRGQPPGGCVRRYRRGHRGPEPAKLLAPTLQLLPGGDADYRWPYPHHRHRHGIPGGSRARGFPRS